MLEVENRGFADMVIYALNGGQRTRLGLATGNSTKSFSIPAYLIRRPVHYGFSPIPSAARREPR